MELAEVRDARVRVEVGLAVDHRLQRPAGVVVAAQLHQSVGEHAERLVDLRGEHAGPPGVGEGGAEVVARQVERPAGGQRARVCRRQRERAAHRGPRPRIERRVRRLARLLQVRAREARQRLRRRRRGGELRDPRVGARAAGGDGRRSGGRGRAMQHGERRQRRHEGDAGGDHGPHDGFSAGVGSCLGSSRLSLESRPDSNGATYGNDDRKSTSLRSTPSPSGSFLPIR